ncbi:hypothetical protein R70211_01326 [Paraburkholderia domus]|uniref:Uncharacterized protein n=1 Tax=Paraburkholderia domus TaxID=2793075 RepID=A0A9N8MMC9_9BURK|nr:hypothetical protein R70211_01326 [Paraburkholderia domus]
MLRQIVDYLRRRVECLKVAGPSPMTNAMWYCDEVAGILPMSLCPQVRTLPSLPR